MVIDAQAASPCGHWRDVNAITCEPHELACSETAYDARAAASSQAKGRGMFGSIVVGTDGSDTAREAVRQATELAQLAGATLEVVSAYEPISEARLRGGAT